MQVCSKTTLSSLIICWVPPLEDGGEALGEEWNSGMDWRGLCSRKPNIYQQRRYKYLVMRAQHPQRGNNWVEDQSYWFLSDASFWFTSKLFFFPHCQEVSLCQYASQERIEGELGVWGRELCISLLYNLSNYHARFITQSFLGISLWVLHFPIGITDIYMQSNLK